MQYNFNYTGNYFTSTYTNKLTLGNLSKSIVNSDIYIESHEPGTSYDSTYKYKIDSNLTIKTPSNVTLDRSYHFLSPNCLGHDNDGWYCDLPITVGELVVIKGNSDQHSFCMHEGKFQDCTQFTIRGTQSKYRFLADWISPNGSNFIEVRNCATVVYVYSGPHSNDTYGSYYTVIPLASSRR